MSCDDDSTEDGSHRGDCSIQLPILRSHLVPIPVFQYGFTTCPQLFSAQPLCDVDNTQHSLGARYQPRDLTQVSLSDEALLVHCIHPNLPRHPIVRPPHPRRTHGTSYHGLPDPEKAYEAEYLKGSINPSATIPGGFGFYLSGDSEFKRRCQGEAKEVVMSYRMMLEDGWMWAKGGKLPGVFGGDGDKAYRCTGGRKESRCTCFNVRLMWRANGEGELYTYLPPVPSNHKVLSAVPPRSIRNPDYGYSVGRGAFSLKGAVNNWMSVAIRIRMNRPGKQDGQMELWIDGRSVISVDELVIRGDGGQDEDQVHGDGARLQGMHFQTFFGGHTEEWASPKTQHAWFADVTGVVIE